MAVALVSAQTVTTEPTAGKKIPALARPAATQARSRGWFASVAMEIVARFASAAIEILVRLAPAATALGHVLRLHSRPRVQDS
jgi:hypothetical protein